MHVMDGKQFLKKIFQIHLHANIIVSSSYSANGSTEKKSEDGATGFVGKRYDMKQVPQAVREFLDEC
jgi:DNA-binding NarL/FixJ family response regulator